MELFLQEIHHRLAFELKDAAENKSFCCALTLLRVRLTEGKHWCIFRNKSFCYFIVSCAFPRSAKWGFLKVSRCDGPLETSPVPLNKPVCL